MLPQDCTEFPTEICVLDQRQVTGDTWPFGTYISLRYPGRLNGRQTT